MNLSLEEIAKAVGGALEGPGSAKVRGYSIDSRTLSAGELFFAIRGRYLDGHNFLGQAAERRACGAVVSEGFQLSDPANGSIEGNRSEAVMRNPGLPLIRVASTTDALQTLARDVRRRWGMPIIGITGSAGKTTTKEMVAAVLGRKFTVLRSAGNLNNEYGLPLCLLRVERHQNMGVLEMGMSAKGEIRKLASICEPSEGVITNVNAAHLEFFKSVDEIAEAKAELLAGLTPPGTAYLNSDDPRVRGMARKFGGKIVSWGVKSMAAFKVSRIQDLGLGGTAFTVRHNRRDVPFVLPLLGTHNVSNALAAIAVGATHDVRWEEIRSAVSEMKPDKMRGQVIKFREGFTVIDDSYNSNPKALTAMIKFLAKAGGYQRKIVVAGEMLELGTEGPALHRACGRVAAQTDAELIVGVRGLAREFLTGALRAGAAESRLKFVSDAVEAGELLARTVKKGDLILLKGSRGVRLEHALNALRATFSSLEP